MTSALSLSHVSCFFSSGNKQVRAVDDVSLDIEAGEFFTLLGPSGSGKTTCLRMIGGFTLPTRGSISLQGEDVTHKPPYARQVNTVFQDYALFPHMSILDNVAYSLMIRGESRKTREKKALDLLDTVQLTEMAGRKPTQLSGGQRQRVALARALISEPKVLLLDEPLGALDLKLREQMQSELKSLQRKLGITFIFVTHDQHEALSMSDRIGIFNSGKLEQVASPSELYNRPKTRFVAEFIGTANVLRGIDANTSVMIRPEHITLGETTGAQTSGVIAEVQYFGSFWRLRVERNNAQAMVIDLPITRFPSAPELGSAAHLHWSEQALHTIAHESAPEAA